MSQAVFLSIHDVMPESMDRIQSMMAQFRDIPCHHIQLLVVPDRSWSAQQLNTLQEWAQSGYALVGHGWQHVSLTRKTWKHRFHSRLISNNVAEHLSRNEDEIIELIHRCHQWFGRHDLPEPLWYVPPAWAMGAVDRFRLRFLPFRFYEYLTGVYDSSTNQFVRLPLLGFEAEHRFRSWTLATINQINRGVARILKRPIRLSIHPRDLELRMELSLRSYLSQCLSSGPPHSAFRSAPAAEWLTHQTGMPKEI